MKKSILLMTMFLLICLLLTSCGTYLPDYVTFWREISPEDTIKLNEDIASRTMKQNISA